MCLQEAVAKSAKALWVQARALTHEVGRLRAELRRLELHRDRATTRAALLESQLTSCRVRLPVLTRTISTSLRAGALA